MYGGFDFRFFEWFAGLSRPVRLTVSLFLVLIGGGAWFASSCPWVWLSGLGTGAVLLLFSFSED